MLCKTLLTALAAKDALRWQVRYNKRLFRAVSRRYVSIRRRPFPQANQASEPMLETNPIHNLIKDLAERTDVLRGYL